MTENAVISLACRLRTGGGCSTGSIALSAAALVVYRLILEGTTRQAITQRDSLLEQLSR